MYCVFKFVGGLGNRLSNLMNMFYVHKMYPHVNIYVIWLENNHCNIKLNELFDFSNNDWMLEPTEYHTTLFPQYRHMELYASTSIHSRTRWDNIDEWALHPALVSVSFHLYSFVSYDFCIETFKSFKFSKKVMENVQLKLERHGLHNNVIHYRKGDLLKLLQENEQNQNATDLDANVQELCLKHPDWLRVEYNQMIVNRPSDQVIDSLGDLLYFSKYCTIVAYSPYSWFSSWMYMLSKDFNNVNPIFDPRMLDIKVV